MSGDYSRLSYDPRRHFAAVLAEQGRVSTDFEENEEVATVLRRFQAEGLDIIGWAAVPRETPNAFQIELQGGNLRIGQGRIYVDGLLVENHGGPAVQWDRRLAEQRGTTSIPYNAQPYFPTPPALPQAGKHVAYLKAWQREVTSIEDPRLIEPALGIDTTTRLQTVWQVKLLSNLADDVTCATPLQNIPEFVQAEPGAGGRLTTGTADSPADPNPCRVPPGAGYKGSENQLYRVEIHRGGVAGANGATFKWSRDNATVASRVTSINGLQLVVDSLGRDEFLSFAGGDWVEITDDWLELAGLPGEMRRIKVGDGVEEATRTIVVEGDPLGMFPVDGQFRTAAERNTRIRRWDHKTDSPSGTLPITSTNTAFPLELGVMVTFNLEAGIGTFRTGDHWCFAARANAAPEESLELLDRAPPHGIHAHYAKLAIVTFPANVTDCRVLIAPLADQFTLFYVSGDTQQGMPDVSKPANLVPLPHELVAGVANGGWPVASARIRFETANGILNSQGSSGKIITVATGPLNDAQNAGLARVRWELDPQSPGDAGTPSHLRFQTVVATLLDNLGNKRGLPVRFSATLAKADHVSYTPDKCANLTGTKTVQEALDQLCGIIGGGCDTLTLSPGPGWVDALSKFFPGDSATVCFRPGVYETEGPVEIKELNHIRITGAGPATILRSQNTESVLRFAGCTSVHLADIGLEVASFPQDFKGGQSGTVTTVDCRRVELDRVKLVCPIGPLKTATCLTVQSQGPESEETRTTTTKLVRVSDSEFVVGHGQIGVLVVNADRVHVSSCEFRTPALGVEWDVPRLLLDDARLGKAVGQVFRGMAIDREELILPGAFNTAVRVRGMVVRMNSSLPSAEIQKLVNDNPPDDRQAATPEGLAQFMRTLFSTVPTQPTLMRQMPRLTEMTTGLSSRMGMDTTQFLASPQGQATVEAMLAGTEIDVKPAEELAAIQRSVNLKATGATVRFNSPIPQGRWNAALDRVLPPGGDTSPVGLAKQVKAVARRVLQDLDFSAEIAPGFLANLALRNIASAACGIRVAGSMAGNVSIEGNSFESTTEAIHVAASYKPKFRPTRRVDSVRIRHNDIVLSVPFELPQAARAIFVGNAEQTIVADNRSRMLSRSARTGIHVEGNLGPHIVVRDNDLRGCETGVEIWQHGSLLGPLLWLVAHNFAPGASPVVKAPPQADTTQGNIG